MHPANSFVRDLAARVASGDVAQPGTPLGERLRRHAFDACAAAFAGAQTSEARATTRVLRRLGGAGAPGALAAALAAAGRCTECDDIDLPSCTTPGAAVFPAALAAVALAPDAGAAAIAAGIAGGYEVMTAVGTAADGATIVYAGRWPTYLGAALTAAATVARILAPERLLDALAIAATMTTGVAGRIAADPTSRWLTFACAVQSGVAAGLAAADGIHGDAEIFAEALPLDPARVPERREPALARIALKPYHTGRQALAATEAFAELLRDANVDPAAIERIEVLVPPQYRAMIDRSARPRSKGDSRGIRYQLALAALHPDELYDVERAHLRVDEPAMTRLMDAVEVLADPELGALYPRLWPATVRVTTAATVLERTVEHPRGDPERPLDDDALALKWTAICGRLPLPFDLEELRGAAARLDLAAIGALLAPALAFDG